MLDSFTGEVRNDKITKIEAQKHLNTLFRITNGNNLMYGGTIDMIFDNKKLSQIRDIDDWRDGFADLCDITTDRIYPNYDKEMYILNVEYKTHDDDAKIKNIIETCKKI